MTRNKETVMNTDRLNDIARRVLYTLAVVLPAIAAGYAATGSALPDWLLFATAVVSALGGGTALGNFSHRAEG